MSTSLRASIVVASVMASSVHAQTLVRTVNGPAANGKFGKACIVVPDQNGDGYKDLLVGAPGFNQERGAIYCVSGAFLGTGTGVALLWSCAPTANQGDLFGTAIAAVGDLTGDGVGDFLVGQPGYDSHGFNDRGAIRLVSGASHAVVSLIVGIGQGEMLGSAIAAVGDVDLDGRMDVLVGAPGPAISTSRVVLFKGSRLAISDFALLLMSDEVVDTSGAQLGAALASNFAYVNHGTFAQSMFIAGAPGFDAPGAPDAGKLVVGTVTFGGAPFSIQDSYVSSFAGERLGAAVDAAHDYDGDGVIDYLVGAPHARDASNGAAGRVVVISGLRLLLGMPPYDLLVLKPTVSSNGLDLHFGAAVRASPDINGDGVGEILIGAPEYLTFGPGGVFQLRGLVSLFSGATGVRWNSLSGASTDGLGDGLAGALDDLDGDGLAEYVVAGSRSDVGGADSGVLKCYRLFPLQPASYCTGKINSLGCTPAMTLSGSPSASSGQSFTIGGANFVNQKNGLLFYGQRPTAVLFQGGTKCVLDPVVRTTPMNSGGASTGASCTGVYSVDFNALIASGFDPSLVVGAELFAQYWARDPQSPSHTSLSNAVRFVVNP